MYYLHTQTPQLFGPTPFSPNQTPSAQIFGKYGQDRLEASGNNKQQIFKKKKKNKNQLTCFLSFIRA